VAQSLLQRQRIRRQALPASDPAAVLVIEGGAAPENCTGPIRRFAPDLVILVDAAHMEEAPGTIRWLDWQDLAGLSASTHTLPPSILAHYLTVELGCRVALVGIQPQQTDVGAPLSEAVQAAVDKVVTELSGALWGTPPRARAHEGIDSRATVP
jgi:hydrogenase 3 maturation protease